MTDSFFDSNMTDKEFARKLVAAFDLEMQNMKPEDFEVDEVQLEKLKKLAMFFDKAAKDLGGKIVSVDLDPLVPPCGITANFIVFDLFGDEVKKFCDVLRECSAVSMDATDSGEVSISCTIPGIFVEKT